MTLRYLVQLADGFGFDFGRVRGGVAAFECKGDAVLFAQELRRRTGSAARVVNRELRTRPIVFNLLPLEQVAEAS